MGLIATPLTPRPASITHPAEQQAARVQKAAWKENQGRRPTQATSQHLKAGSQRSTPAQVATAPRPPARLGQCPKSPEGDTGKHRTETTPAEARNPAARNRQRWRAVGWAPSVARRAGGKRPTQHPAPNQETTRITLKKKRRTKPSRRRGGAARAQVATHRVEEGAVGPEVSITR